jgi:tetratricopeptide (TPR) repeat protein
MQSYYDKGYKLLQTGDYLGAIQVFQQVDSKASCYSDVLDEMTYCRDKYIQSVIQNVSTAIEEERYVDALNELTEGLSYCEDSQELKDKKNEVLSVFKEKNKEIANASAEGGDYMSAIEYLNEIIKFDSNDSEVNELFREYNKQIILTNVYELKKSGKYMDALNVIKNSAYAEDEELQDLYLEINSLYNENEIQYETNFYGIWCYASKDYSDAQINADTLIKYGFDAQVILTTDWDNLNAEKWYVVTAGMYSTEEDAKEDLPSVQTVCKTAYVKYSGNPK